MSKLKGEGNILPPLQKRIVLCLARKGLQTINEVTTNIPILGLAKRSHYKPTWLAFKWLQEKGLIHEAGVKKYKGRDYPKFWLTDDGAMMALTEGAPIESLLAEVKKIYPDNQTLACYLDVASKMNPNAFKVGYLAIRSKGKIEAVDFTNMLLVEMYTKKPDEKIKEIVETLKAYPQEYATFKKKTKQALQDINKLNEII